MAEQVTTTVNVNSAWWSKINWTQVVGITASALVVATGGKFNLPLEQQASIVLLIQTAQGIATWIWKTWFTTSITSGSLERAEKQQTTQDAAK